ncbi:MAG: hypothetical protein LAO76_27560 [Acidobacteriia bacterium]|nr:hypothetical protein [Terriglobia bacterium]
MRVHLILIVCVIAGIGAAQTQESKVIPGVTTVPIEEGAVRLLYLAHGYTTSVKLPEEISSVVIGNPGRLQGGTLRCRATAGFLEALTTQPSESNALITTKSGQEIPLHLASG